MSLVEPGQVAVDADGPKVEVIATDYDDEYSITVVVRDEDHTLLNPLRHIIQKNPAVTFCGYSIPHPSESRANIRIQTDGSETSINVLHTALDQLMDMCQHIYETFETKVKEGKYEKQ